MYLDREYRKIGWLNLPSVFRTPLAGAIAEVMMQELQLVHTRIMARNNDVMYKIEHTSQVCYLQAALNDAIDPIQRRIKIFDTVISSAVVPRLYERVYNSPIVLGTIALNTREYYNIGSYDFQVVVPFDLSSDETNKIKAWLQFYKLAGKRYLLTNVKIENI